MIDKDIFLKFISDNFRDDQLYVYKFKSELWFVEIDCFPDMTNKLTIEISDEDIRFATVDKKPAIDFSLYDFIFEENKQAELFIQKIIQQKSYPFDLK